jgi:hypothetical protein
MENTPIIDINTYGGQQVAIVDGRIVAAGTDTEEVLQAAQQEVPGATWQDILLVSVPKSLNVIYSV